MNDQKVLMLNSASIHTVQTLADGTIKIVLHMREMSPEDMAAIFTHKGAGKEGVAFTHDTDAEPKTKSQRLKAALYVLWQHNTNQSQEFEEFYNSKMESIIETVKSKID